VPLQAGHITSTMSDFVGLIKRASLRLRTTHTIPYIFPKLRNQLRGVTLNNKVKLKLVLIGSRTTEYVRYGFRR
jgi:hypothetical protein